MTREEAVEAVKGPGKFEGERPYVPYFWEMGLDGFSESDLGDGTFSFAVSKEDLKLFPELGSQEVVLLHERDDGFVVELRAET